jgi:hypothetical protein
MTNVSELLNTGLKDVTQYRVDVLSLCGDCGVIQEKEVGLDPPHADDRLGNN